MTNKVSIWPSIPTLVAKTTSVDQAPVPIFWADESGHIGYANEPMGKLSGYPCERLINQKLELLIPSMDTRSWTNGWWPILLKDKEISALSTTFRHHKGMAIERNISATLVNVSGLSFAVFYLWPKVNNPSTFNNNSATHFLDNLNECVGLLDNAGKVHYANPSLCQKLNVLSSDLMGHSLLEFITPNESQLSNVWQALQQDQPSETEFGCQNIAGTELVLRMNVVPQQSQNKEQKQLLISFVDITEQHAIAKELEQRNASFERLAANIPGFIYKFKMTANGEFSFPYASIGCQEIFGVDPADVANDATPIMNTIHPDDVPLFQDSVMASAGQLSPWNLEARLSTIKNEWKWFHAASRPELQKNGDIIWEGLVMDVTDRKQAEGELAEAKENAEASAAPKAAFLSNMSHEIRTPLNAIIGLTRLVLESDLSSSQQEYLDKVLSSSEVLLGIVNNVLDFSKIESGKLQVEQIEFSLSTVLENVGIILEAQAAEKGLELLIDIYSEDYEYLIGDPLRLQQVLINFCNNAIKFTDQGEILISVQAIEQHDTSVKLKFIVKDTGIGLTESQQQKIFESFTQADNSTTRKYGGTGLGLTICKQIVELMGGEIGVESTINEGSEFYFSAALNKASVCLKEKEFKPLTTKNKQLLYVNDNAKACQLHSQILNDSGLQVKAVHTQSEAIEILHQHLQNSSFDPFDLIILDWQLSDQHGIETVRQIRKNHEYCQIPIMMMISTCVLDRFNQLSDEPLITSFINKPLIKSKWLKAIQDILVDPDSPTDVQATTDTQPSDLVEDRFSGKRVLLAEDNAINQEIAQTILERKGIEVFVVNNGREAVDWLLANINKINIEAILMDLQMPEMDGFEAARLIRENSNFDNIPILAMTAHVFESEKEKCLSAGMQGHISKPIEPEKLFTTLGKAISKKPSPNQESVELSETMQTHAENKAASLSALSTVDVISAKKMLNEDELLLTKLLHKFANEQAGAVTEIKQQVFHNQHSRAAKLAHLIKGVAGNLHITDVFDSAVHLEDALTNKSMDNLGDLLSRFEKSFKQFKNEIGYLDKTTEHNVTEQDTEDKESIAVSEQVIDKLDTLINHLDNNNFKAQSCLEELNPFLAKYCQQEFGQFSELIMELNFSAAAEIARNLKYQLSETCP